MQNYTLGHYAGFYVKKKVYKTFYVFPSRINVECEIVLMRNLKPIAFGEWSYQRKCYNFVYFC